MKVNKPRKNRSVFEFDSVSEYREEMKSYDFKEPHNIGEAERYMDPENVSPGSSFHPYSLEETNDWLDNGWLDSLGKIEAMARAVSKAVDMEVPDRRRKRRRCDVQGEVDVDRLNRGRTDGLFQRKIRTACTTTAPVVTVVLEWGANCNVGGEQMFWNCVPGLIVSKILEDSGYRVNLIAWSPSNRPDAPAETQTDLIIHLKKPQEQLRMGHLTALMANATAFRTWGFLQIVAAADVFGHPAAYGLGQHPDKAPFTRLQAAMPKLKPEETFLMERAFSREEAIKETTDKLGQFMSGNLNPLNR